MLVCLSAAGQNPSSSVPVSATLPESNEAILLSQRAEEAIRRGDFRLALELIDQVRRLPDGLVAAHASRTYYPAARQVARLLAQLPPKGIELYRQLHDAEVQARLDQARARADVDALTRLFGESPLSSHWGEVGRELASLRIERGEFGDAVAVLREMLATAPADAHDLRAQRVVALARSGALRTARDAMEELRTAAAGRGEWTARLAQLERWLDGELERGDVPAARRGFAPRLCSPLGWTVPLALKGEPVTDDIDRDVASFVEQSRRLPLQRAVDDGEMLIVRSLGVTRRVDAWTGETLWSAAQPPTGQSWSGPVSIYDEPRETGDLSGLLDNVLAHEVAVGQGLVFTVEPRTLIDPSMPRLDIRGFGARIERARPNELVARDLATGRVVWTSSGSLSLAGAAFQACPILVGERLAVPIQRERSLYVALVEARTGEVVRETLVVGPPTRFGSASGGRCMLVADESTLYVCTGNGVIAALDAFDLGWKWATIYPNTLADYLRRYGFPPENEAADRFDPPVLADELLIVAPIDSPDLIALDRFTGRERWRVSRERHGFVVGALRGGIVVGGSRLTCLDLADGATVRWRTVPLGVCGRPTIAAGKLFVPTLAGMVVVDGASGMIIEDASLGENCRTAPQLAANLQPVREGLLALSPTRLTIFADLEALRASAPSHEPPARAALREAWIDALDQRLEAALARLEEMPDGDTGTMAARDRLLSQVCGALAGAAATPAERLAWLRRASAASRSPEQSARVALRIGEELERAGTTRAALEHYGEMLLAAQPAMLAEGGAARLSWLEALRRIEALVDSGGWPAGLGERAALVRHLVTQAAGSPSPGALLLRIEPLAITPEMRQALREALLRCDLPPEILVSRLPQLDDAADPALLLRRWSVHAALGMTAEAVADEARWARSGASGDEREIELLRARTAKLQRLAAPDFDASPRRQWLARRRWLAAEPGSAMPILPPVITLLDIEEPALGVHRRVTGDLLRRPVGVPVQLPGPRAPFHGFFEGRRHELDITRPGLPLRVDGATVLVTAPGELLCVALGTERPGNNLLWRHESADLVTSIEALATGEMGVYAAVRPERVALLSRLDGQPIWQVETGRSVRRLALAGERLVIGCSDGTLLTVDARSGAELAELPGAWQGMAAFASTLVAWSPERLVAMNAASGALRWQIRGEAILGVSPMVEASLLAYRTRDGWSLVDVGQGDHLMRNGFERLEQITAWHVESGTCYIAGIGHGMDTGPSEIVLIAYDLRTQRVRWQESYVTRAFVNGTQLAGHPELIPLMLVRSGRDDNALDAGSASLLLVHKTDGRAAGSVPLESHLTESGLGGPVYLWVTRERIVLQAFDSVIAFGSSLVGGQR